MTNNPSGAENRLETLLQPEAEEARRLLNDVFGYHEFRGAQADVIGHVADGGDALVLMPTGGGKSLCYQIPSLMRPGVGLVVSPLIALMQDQVDALAQLGVRAAFLNSSQDFATAQQIERKVRQGEIDLLYVAPERLLTDWFLNQLTQLPLALFAIDEAHCVSQWGHDFRPEYRKLSILHERFPEVPRIALTATADPLTREDIIVQLKLQDARIFIASFDRPNIRYRVAERAGSRQRQLLDFLTETDRRTQAGIIYCGSRKKVDETAEWLGREGFNALPYHAGMDQGARRRNQQRFLREDGIIMTATIAFGMGIDKPDVRFVAHLDMPQSLESYYQETGRAGRDGEAADAWLTYSLGDIVHLYQRIDESEMPDAQKRVMRQKLEAMLGFCETAQCRRTMLLDYFGEITARCGNCDTCLDPPETWDGTIAAQKLMSAALRTGQRFGGGYLMEILLGKPSERATQNGHDKLPTFGVGKDIPEKSWRAIVRQMVMSGYLHSNAAHYGALELTDKARPVLKGEIKLMLRRIAEKPRRSRRDRQADRDGMQAPVNQMLFDELRALRTKLAAAQNVPAYVIFHDSTLRELAQSQPQTPDALRGITGIGSRKLARYGEELLTILKQHTPAVSSEAKSSPPKAGGNLDKSPTIEASVALFRQSRSIDEVAVARKLTPSTIYTHLAEAIAEGMLSLEDVIQLDDAEFAAIEAAFESCAESAPGKLGPVFQMLEGKYDYGVLKCVGAARGWKG